MISPRRIVLGRDKTDDTLPTHCCDDSLVTQEVMIRALSNWGNEHLIGLSKIQILVKRPDHIGIDIHPLDPVEIIFATSIPMPSAGKVAISRLLSSTTTKGMSNGFVCRSDPSTEFPLEVMIVLPVERDVVGIKFNNFFDDD